jgi:hypothetical protein
MKKVGVFLRVALMAGVWSCTNVSTKEHGEHMLEQEEKQVFQSIAPPFKGVEVPQKTFKVQASQGTEWKFENGTQINIPEHAFVDKNGKTVEGTVTVQYREYHYVEEVMVSGIPMTYQAPDNKEVEHFITTGMFEISGQYEGEEVQIAPHKKIEVNMASFDANPTANFYVLDKKTNAWNLVSKSVIAKRPVEAAKKETGDMPAKMDPDAFKFDMKVDYEKFPELGAYKNVIWQYVEAKGYDNPETVPNFYEEVWAYANLEAYDVDKKQYQLILSSKKKSLVCIVTPVLGERDYRKVLKEHERKMKRYEADVAATASIRSNEAEITRQVQISEFGTYNHDVFAQVSEPVVVNAEIKIKGQEGMATRSLESFLVVKSKNAVIRYSGDGYDNYSAFTFGKEDENALIVLLPNKKIAVFKKEDFKKAKVDEKHYVFQVDQHTTEISSLRKMAEVIQSL